MSQGSVTAVKPMTPAASAASLSKIDRDVDRVGGVEEPDQTWHYREVADGAARVRGLYAERGLRLHRDSVLGKLLREAEALHRDWETSGGSGTSDIHRLVAAAHSNRIIHVLGLVGREEEAEEALKRIAANVDLGGRTQSQGKDALWELELLAKFRTRGIQAAIVDPPDLVVQVSTGEVGIACKKIYSERGVEAQVRKGCKQLAPYAGAGLVALNLDDLLPGHSILRTANMETARQTLAGFIDQFLARHRRVLEPFIRDGKCDGFLLSASAQADIEASRVRFNNYTHSTVWTLERSQGDSIMRIRELARRLGAPELAVQG